MSLLLRIHPRIHNQWGKTGMCPLALDFLKHVCAKKTVVIANHLLIVGVCGMLLMISHVMTNQLRTRDRLGKKRRDLTGQRDSSFAISIWALWSTHLNSQASSSCQNLQSVGPLDTPITSVLPRNQHSEVQLVCTCSSLTC